MLLKALTCCEIDLRNFLMFYFLEIIESSVTGDKRAQEQENNIFRPTYKKSMNHECYEMFVSAINVFDGPSLLRPLFHMLLQTIEFCYQNCISRAQ